MKKIVSILMFSIIVLVSCTTKVEKKVQETTEELAARISHEENHQLKIDSVGILAYDGFNDLDFVGIQTELNSIMGVKSFLIAAKKGEVKGTENTYKVGHEFSEINHLDVLIIPGGNDATYKLTKDSLVLNWIKKIDKTSTYTASVCNGAWILGATVLLEGKNATSHWYRAEEMLKRYGAHYQNKRWVKDGKYWTAAGVSAGMDMGLAMVKEAKGKTYAEFVQLSMEYDPQPPVDKGSKEKADPAVVKMMTEMFDIGLGVEDLEKSEPANKNTRKESEQDVKRTTNNTTLATTYDDLVCGMSVSAELADTLHYHGKTYGFCSSFCKEKFKNDPEEYLK
ncbi:DJ-1/PfpI family protein [Sphingobacterium sp. LRF_L2]|uniref:DJ-1/PfpI family protein n=1 Tax=Sphingobacterium sp. LRF_L2 TaxID=3369421 RepID=UPI003F629CCE